MASWLSVGKSFKSSENSNESALQVQIYSGTDNQASVTPEKAEKQKKRKHGKTERKEKKAKKEKKSKKSHKDSKERSKLNSQLEPWRGPSASTDIVVDGYNSDSFSSDSSDEEASTAKYRRLMNDPGVRNGTMELTYLPNGEVVLLPRRAAASEVQGADWQTDRRPDQDMILYEGMHPRDVVEYTIHLSAHVINDDSSRRYRREPSLSDRQQGVATSSQLFKRSSLRPSGLMVPALKQHRDYEGATKTAQIFLHRQQLLSERHRELRLQHQHRYHAPAARRLLEEPSLRRLDMRVGADGKISSGGDITSSAVVPLPFLDPEVVTELGFAGQKGRKLANLHPNSEEESTGFATAAEKAHQGANARNKEVNQSLRAWPHDLQTILTAVSAQDTICIQQRIASGRPYSSLRNSLYGTSKNKADIALRRHASERKVSILEQALSENRGSSHTCAVLRDRLVHELQRAGQQPESLDKVYSAALQDTPLDTEVHLAQWVENLGVFSRSDYKTLTTGLESIHNTVSKAAYNILAAQELSQMVDASLPHSSVRDVSKLQQEYSRAALEGDLLALRCDVLYLRLLLEQRMGHTERAVAMVQSIVDLNLSGCPSVDEYCAFWDSEYARLGEVTSSLPSAYMPQQGSDGLLAGVLQVGYSGWVQAGRPAAAAAQLGLQSDSTRRVFEAWEAVFHLGQGQPQQHQVQHQYLHQQGQGASDSIHELVAVASAEQRKAPEGEVQMAALQEASEDAENEAAADLFLRQVLGCEAAGVGAEGAEGGIDEGEGEEKEDGSEGEVEERERELPGHRAGKEKGLTIGEQEPTVPDLARQGEEEEMIYSRLHGYKIKVSREPTGAIYRKVLSEIAPDRVQPVDSVAGAMSEDKGTAEGGNRTNGELPVFNPVDASCPQFAKYRAHVYATQAQWRPLKATAEVDAAAAEEQPERVIFSDDIRAALFICRAPPQPGVADAYVADLSRNIRARLVMRCLSALEVSFPHCEASHSNMRRFSGVFTDDASGLNDRAAVLGGTGSLSNSRDYQLCVVSPELLSGHVHCCDTGFDSRLNFVVRLVADILHLATAARQNSDPLMPAGFVSHLRVVLVQLLTARLQCELTSALRTESDRESALQQWRAQCRSVIEASVGDSNTAQPGSAAPRTNQAGESVPAVGDLRVWAAYLTAEQVLGHTPEALKLADKVLKSLNGAGSGSAGYAGHSGLIVTAVCLVTAPTTPPASSLPALSPLPASVAQARTAVALLVQHAHSGSLDGTGHPDPVLGAYGGELKPSKKATAGTGASAVKLSAVAVSSAVERYQGRVLALAEKMHEDLQAADRVRSVEKKSAAVRVTVQDCADLSYGEEIVNLVTLMAALQFMSGTLAGLTQALEVGDAVFTAAIDLLRGLLLRHANLSDAPSPSAAETGRYERYSRHLRQLLGAASTADAPSPLADACYLHGVTLSHSAEVTVAVAIERLHRARLDYLSTYGSQRVHRDLTAAAASTAVRDFPLNPFFLARFCALKASQPAGTVFLRAYFKDITQSPTRQLWGGGLTALECVALVRNEVAHAAQSVMRAVDAEPWISTKATDPAVTVNQQWQQQHPLATLRHWTADQLSRVRAALECVLSTPPGNQLPCLWEFYIILEASFGKYESAKKVFFRGVNHCGWSQNLYVTAAGPCLKGALSDKEAASLETMLEQRHIHWLRV